MAIKVGINGFGRIGRNIMRAAMGDASFDFVAVNDLTNAETLAHLLKYDSILGNLKADIAARGDRISVNKDEFRVLSGDRDLRAFGSQGEQRLAVLSLLLAEAELLTDQVGIPPLLLLDDALSELDADRRRLLSARLGTVGQTLVTATGAEALPLAPAQLLAVTPGTVREA